VQNAADVLEGTPMRFRLLFGLGWQTCLAALLVGVVIGLVLMAVGVRSQDRTFRANCQALGGRVSYELGWDSGGPYLNHLCALGRPH
jgi:hypothetical protein